jgi:multimeric flavodoxin WrbA
MRVVGVSGSPRRMGNTDFAVAQVLELVAAETGAATDFVHLAQYRIERCIGCRSCMTKGECSIQDDDFLTVMERLFAAEGLVIGSPVYWLSPPGVMKDFLDRTHWWYKGPQQVLQGKKAAVLSVAADSGFETHEAAIVSVLRTYGAEVVATEWIHAREKNDLQDSLAEQEKLAEAARKLAEALKKG